jgi:hypothetical protein
MASVVSVGDDKNIILRARAAEREGKLVAPRIIASGSMVTAPGGHPVGTILYGDVSRFRDVALEVAEDYLARSGRIFDSTISTTPGEVFQWLCADPGP